MSKESIPLQCVKTTSQRTDMLHTALSTGNRFWWLFSATLCEKTNSKWLPQGRRKTNNGTVPLGSWASTGTARTETPPRQCVREVIYVCCACLKWQTFDFFSFVFHYNEAEYLMKHTVLSAIPFKGSWTIACSLVLVLHTNYFEEFCKEMDAKRQDLWDGTLGCPAGWKTHKKIGTQLFLIC